MLGLITRPQCPTLWEGHKVSSQVVPSALGTDISLSDDSILSALPLTTDALHLRLASDRNGERDIVFYPHIKI